VSVRTLFVCFLVALTSVAGQTSLPMSRHEGKIITTASTDTLWVELYEGNSHMLTERVPVNRDGTFTVTAQTTQMYEARVVTSHGTRIMSEHVQFRQGQPVELRLPKSMTEGARPGGPISMARLAHKPPKAAKKFLQESESLAERGDLPGSAEHLQKALTADPQWFEAWNNLGSRRLMLRQYAEAAEAFRQALAIDPMSAMVHSNLGLAQLFLRQPLEAEESARRALQLDPGSSPASYVEGMALLQQEKRQEEALEKLRAAAVAVPRALLAVAEWQCRHQNLSGCEADIRTFLKTPRGPNHEAAEKWLGRVKKARSTKPSE
jgi:tetratricopeptide (TPR) repeat protein